MPMTGHDQNLEAAIRHAAGERGLDLAIPANAFLIAKKTPQGWLLEGFADMGTAFEKAGSLARQGNTDVYVVNSFNGGVVGFDGQGQPDWSSSAHR